MKKTALAMLGMFVLSSFSFAGEGKFDKKCKMDPEQKAKKEAVKEEKIEYFKNLEILVNKYNTAADADKEPVKQEITALISIQNDKDIAAKKDMLAAKKEMVAKLEAKIAEMESDKTAAVNKKVDFFLSEQGQEKIQKMSAKKDCSKDKAYCKKDMKDCCAKNKKDCPSKDKKGSKKDKSKKKSK